MWQNGFEHSCYLEVFKGIGVIVGGVDTVEKPVHPHPYNGFLVENKVQCSRSACGDPVQDQNTYIVVIPPFPEVIRIKNRVIP